MSEAICDLDLCSGVAMHNPIILVPVEDQEVPAGLLLKLNVCDPCQHRVGLNDLITEEGRGEILAAVLHQCGIPSDWDAVSLSWVPIGDGDYDGFVDTHVNQVEARVLMEEASEVIKLFMLDGDEKVSFNDGATRLTALIVTAMLEAYVRYRVARSDAGQQFISAVMQTLASHIEERTGDKMRVRVAITQDPDAV